MTSDDKKDIPLVKADVAPIDIFADSKSLSVTFSKDAKGDIIDIQGYDKYGHVIASETTADAKNVDLNAFVQNFNNPDIDKKTGEKPYIRGDTIEFKDTKQEYWYLGTFNKINNDDDDETCKIDNLYGVKSDKIPINNIRYPSKFIAIDTSVIYKLPSETKTLSSDISSCNTLNYQGKISSVNKNRNIYTIDAVHDIPRCNIAIKVNQGFGGGSKSRKNCSKKNKKSKRKHRKTANKK